MMEIDLHLRGGKKVIQKREIMNEIIERKRGILVGIDQRHRVGNDPSLTVAGSEKKERKMFSKIGDIYILD
jgi:hypothetical protein